MSNPKHSTKTVEHYTPPKVIDAARSVMGGIDLDPASCEAANRIVAAANYITEAQDGLRYSWPGRVFLNPPGGKSPAHHKHLTKSSQALWWHYLAQHYQSGITQQAIFVCFSIELFQTCQLVKGSAAHPLDFPVCIPARRLQFYGSQPVHANALIYLPPANNLEPAATWFKKQFAQFGRVFNV